MRLWPSLWFKAGNIRDRAAADVILREGVYGTVKEADVESQSAVYRNYRGRVLPSAPPPTLAGTSMRTLGTEYENLSELESNLICFAVSLT